MSLKDAIIEKVIQPSHIVSSVEKDDEKQILIEEKKIIEELLEHSNDTEMKTIDEEAENRIFEQQEEVNSINPINAEISESIVTVKREERS